MKKRWNRAMVSRALEQVCHVKNTVSYSFSWMTAQVWVCCPDAELSGGLRLEFGIKGYLHLLVNIFCLLLSIYTFFFLLVTAINCFRFWAEPPMAALLCHPTKAPSHCRVLPAGLETCACVLVWASSSWGGDAGVPKKVWILHGKRGQTLWSW